MLSFGFVAQKRHIFAQNRVFWRILRRLRSGVLAALRGRTTKIVELTISCANSRIRETKPII